MSTCKIKLPGHDQRFTLHIVHKGLTEPYSVRLFKDGQISPEIMGNFPPDTTVSAMVKWAEHYAKLTPEQWKELQSIDI